MCWVFVAEHQRIGAFEPWCWRRLLRVPWTARRSTKSILKEISPEYSLEGLGAEAEVPVLWPTDVISWLIGKDPDAGEDCRQEEKGMTEDKMIGWHRWLNGHEFKQTRGVDGQGGLACCSPWGRKESDVTGHWATELSSLCYCPGFSVVAESEDYSGYDVWASRCSGFSCGAWAW